MKRIFCNQYQVSPTYERCVHCKYKERVTENYVSCRRARLLDNPDINVVVPKELPQEVTLKEKMIDKNVCLLRRGGGLGDLLTTTPIPKAYKRIYPNCHITFCARKDLQPTLENNPYIDKICEQPGDKKDYDAYIKLDDPCPAFDYEQKNYPNITKSRIQLFIERAGLDYKRYMVPEIYLTKQEEEWAKKELSNFKRKKVALALSSNFKYREYPLEHWQKLISLLKKQDFEIFNFSKEPLFLDGTNIANYPLRKMFALIKYMDLVICVDSAIMHIAATFGKRTLALFGPIPPKVRIYPNMHYLYNNELGCTPCWYEYKPECMEQGSECMMSIKPKHIVERIQDMPFAGKKSKDNVLLLVGEGIGNILQEMILVPTLRRIYKEVDVFIAKQNFPIERLFKNVKIYTDPKELNLKKYKGKLETLWGKHKEINLPVLNDRHKQDINILLEEGKSEIQSSVEVARDLGLDQNDIIYDLDSIINIDKKTTEKFDIVLANCANDFNKWNCKRYLHWKELSAILSKRYTICSIGSKKEYILGTIDKTGLTIDKTAKVIKKSRLVITNDSGIYHLCNVLKVPNIVIFTNTSIDKNYDERFHRYSHLIYKPFKERSRCQTDVIDKVQEIENRNIPPQWIINKAVNILSKKNILISLSCYNGHQRLQRSLPTLFESKNNAEFDVYILDDNSSPPIQADYPVILEKRDERSKSIGEVKTQLLEKILKLDYDYYYLTDDDFYYSDGWLDKCVDMLDKPNIGIATVFCHPKDFEKFKDNIRGEYYYPESTSGGSLFISKEDLKKLYEEKKDFLRERKGLWDYNLSKAIFDIGKKVISPTYSLVQHNPWNIRGAFDREPIQGLRFQGEIEDKTKVSIIILCHNELEFTRQCIESIKKYTEIPYQLVVIDNGSTDQTPEYLKTALREKDICIRNFKNRSFSESNNNGIRLADGEYVLILNNDTEVLKQGWLRNFLRASIGMDATGASMCYNEPNKEKNIFDWKNKNVTDWGYLEGWCILIKKALFLEMGGFDSELFSPIYCEDADFSYRLKKLGKKFKEVSVPIKHYRNKTVRNTGVREFIPRNVKRLYSKHIDRKYQYEKIHEKIRKQGIYQYCCFKDMCSLLDLIYDLPTGSKIVEIGTAFGQSAFAMAMLKPQCLITTMDGYNSKEVKWYDYFLNYRRALKLGLENVVLIQRLSQDFSEEYKDTIDFLWIDGDHQYESVKKDILLWGNKLKPNSTICGHDYHHSCGGVEKAVKELIKPLSYSEFKLTENESIWYAKKS